MSKKEIALTFDDGPNPPSTNQVLDILDIYDAKATFFVIGKNALKYPDLVKEIVARGHRVGNHSFQHNHVLTAAGLIEREVLRTEEILTNLIGDHIKIFRSPYTVAPPWLNRRLKKRDYIIAPTSQAAWGHDYVPGITQQAIENTVLSRIKNNSVLLLHDGVTTKGGDRLKTVEALKNILEKLANEGYDFVDLLTCMKNRNYRQIFYP